MYFRLISQRILKVQTDAISYSQLWEFGWNKNIRKVVEHQAPLLRGYRKDHADGKTEVESLRYFFWTEVPNATLQDLQVLFSGMRDAIAPSHVRLDKQNLARVWLGQHARTHEPETKELYRFGRFQILF